MAPLSPELALVLKGHVANIVALAVKHAPPAKAVLVTDAQSGLSRLVGDAYRACLPDAQHLDFDAVTPAEVMAAFATLSPGDLVVLVQSSSFRLDAFRIRVELFKRGLKVIEHPHLGRMLPDEYACYVDSLQCDGVSYRQLGTALKALLDVAQGAVLDSGGAQLVYRSRFETARLNLDDYTGMKNVGGQFPIGEVFTEPVDLESVNGRVRIFAFGGSNFLVNVPERPATLVVERGKVVGTQDATPELERVLDQIRADEEVWVRELGFGMNRAFTRDRRVSDIGSYERMCGIHMSLGAKHGIYAKPAIRRNDGRHHVDVFAVTEAVWLDGVRVYQDGRWTV